MPDDNGPHEYAPNQQARAELHRFHRRPAEKQLGKTSTEKEHGPGNENDLRLPEVALKIPIETLAQKVSRITLVNDAPVQFPVLDQDPAHVTPEKVDQRAMGVRLLVGVLMMAAMNRDPARRRVLQAAKS